MPKQESDSSKKLAMPVKNDGSKDKRYTNPQVTKSDGTRDMRTNLTSKK